MSARAIRTARDEAARLGVTSTTFEVRDVTQQADTQASPR
jgi:hypothetical protein